MRAFIGIGVCLLIAVVAGCGGGNGLTLPDDGGSGGGSGNLAVRSNPSGAAISVDGANTGRLTPYTLDVAAGSGLGTEHVVTLSLSGYHVWSALVTVAEGETFTLNATLTPSSAGRGAIQAASEPSGARIFLDGTDTGRTTPATLENVPATQHVIEYRLGGFHAFREEVVVDVGRTARSHPTLTRVGYGRVTGRVVDGGAVSDQVAGLVGAEVSVRGTDIKTTTTMYGIFTLPNVPEGVHTLNVAAEVGGVRLVGTRDGVQVLNGRTTANADIITSAGGAFGRIEGRVTDVRGNAIAGATLFASQATGEDFLPDSTIAPRQAEADADGHYVFDSLPQGFWVVTAAYPNYATVTQGMGPQIYLTAGRTVTVNFTLPPSTTPRPSPPRSLEAVAFTMPASVSRAPQGYAAIRDRLLAVSRTGRWDARAGRSETRTVRRTRTAPSGSLIEVDLSWLIPGDPDIVGYFIGRSNRSDSGFSLIEDLLNPHAGFWIDYDSRLTAGRSYYYRVSAVNIRGLQSDPSGVADARPLGQVRALAPDGLQTSATPTFSWEALEGGFLYGVQLFDRFPDGFVEPIWESESLLASQTSIRYSSVTPLQSGHTYYWVVLAGNSADAGSINGWSISRLCRFTVQ